VVHSEISSSGEREGDEHDESPIATTSLPHHAAHEDPSNPTAALGTDTSEHDPVTIATMSGTTPG